jgi:hypothetical protein
MRPMQDEFHFPLQEPIQVLYLGARFVSDEEEPVLDLARNYALRIVGFEPDEEECLRLAQLYGPGHTFIARGAGDGSKRPFNVFTIEGQSSFLDKGRFYPNVFEHFCDHMNVARSVEIDTLKVDDVGLIGDVDLLKIDIQGFQGVVLAHAERVLRNTLIIDAELEFVEQYHGQELFDSTSLRLRSAGFQFHKMIGFGSRKVVGVTVDSDSLGPGSQWLWGQFYFLRHMKDLRTINAERLLRMATVLHATLKSFDLALFVLAVRHPRAEDDVYGEYIGYLRRTQHFEIDRAKLDAAVRTWVYEA